jgi:lipopolysaccharide transport system permease protein
MARVALPTKWAGALVRKRGPLQTYQWLWLLCCVLGALVAAAPRILNQPVIYTSTATITLDLTRYGWVYDERQSASYRDAEAIAIKLTRLLTAEGSDQPRYPDLGQPKRGIRYEVQPGGAINVLAVGGSPAEAQQLADDAAEAMARSLRAAGGREIFRQLMGWEQYAAYANAPPRTPFQQTLRSIALYSAFPLNKSVDVVSQPFTVDQLAPEDVSDLARALEVRDVELSRVDLPALRPHLSLSLDRNSCRPLLEAGAASGAVPQADRDFCRLDAGLVAIRAALGYLQNDLGARFEPDALSAVYRSTQAALGTEAPRRIGLLLALAALVGLAFGVGGVVVDRSAGVMPKLREIWDYRELIRNLVLRDLRVRYKGSALGYLWTQLAPLLLMLVFWFVFSTFFRTEIAMFPIFLIVGLLPWNFFNEAVMGGARSVIDNSNLIKKVFFPREVLPLVSVLSSLVNFLLSLPMMFLVMAIVQWLYPPLREQGRFLNFSLTFAYLPVVLIIQTIFLSGVVLFLSALAVFFRDMVHLIGILLQFWFFLTPVVYSLSDIDGRLAQAIRWLNPMASLIDFYREILYGSSVKAPAVPTPAFPALESILRVLLTAVVALAVGYWFFQRRSGEFGEEI